MDAVPDAPVILHFLLYTGWGYLVMVLVASALVAVAVWYAVATVVASIAWTLWRLHQRLNRNRAAGAP